MSPNFAALVGAPARVRELEARFGVRRPPAAAAAKFASALDKAAAAATPEAAAAAGIPDDAPAATPAGPTGENAVTEAKKYLGVPYIWGGNDPTKGLDCSAFTKLAYKNLGIDIPRVSQDQAKIGTKVNSMADAKPGDLIIYNDGAHVAMYMGNGKLIHAPSSGNVIREQNVWQPITAIRRVIPDRPAGAPAATGGPAPISTARLLGAAAPAAPAASTGPAGPGQVKSSVPYADLFNAAGAKHGVSPRLLAAMAKTESNFNPRAGSHAGAQGLMQFMPATARSYGINPWDPAQAVDGAARYMKNSMGMFGGNTEKAVASYNAGPGAVQKYNGIPPYNETQNYVRLVMQRIGEMG